MVKVIKGVLLECDQAVKMIILDLDSTLKFVIQDLDDTHLFIDANRVDLVKQRLDEILEENTYRVSDT